MSAEAANPVHLARHIIAALRQRRADLGEVFSAMLALIAEERLDAAAPDPASAADVLAALRFAGYDVTLGDNGTLACRPIPPAPLAVAVAENRDAIICILRAEIDAAITERDALAAQRPGWRPS